MAVPSVNGTNISDSMKSRGKYTFNRQEIRESGDGTAIGVGSQTITWIFSSMTLTEYQFWTSTLLSGANSVAITSSELWDDEKTTQNFTSGTLYRPTHEFWRGGLFWNVTVQMKHLLPIV